MGTTYVIGYSMDANRLPSFRMRPVERVASGPASWVAASGTYFSFDKETWHPFTEVGQNPDHCLVLRGAYISEGKGLATLSVQQRGFFASDRNPLVHFPIGFLSVPAGTYDLRVNVSSITGTILALGLRRT